MKARGFHCWLSFGSGIAALLSAPMMAARSAETVMNSSDGWEHRLESEAPAAWTATEKARSAMSGTEAAVVLSSHWPGQPPKHYYQKEVAHFDLRNDGRSKIYTQFFDENGRMTGERVCCVNPEYSFRISKRDGSRDYFISSYGRGPSYEARTKQFIDHITWPLGLSCGGFVETPLGVILSQKKFEDLHCALTEEHGVAELSVHLVWREPTIVDRTNPSGIQSIDFTCEPTREWRIRRSVVKFACDGGSTKVETNITYPDGAAALSVPSHIRINDSRPVGPSTTDFDFSDISVATAPADQFYLSAFGIPEIPTERQKRMTKLMRSGIILLIVGAALGYVYRRRLRTTAPLGSNKRSP